MDYIIKSKHDILFKFVYSKPQNVVHFMKTMLSKEINTYSADSLLQWQKKMDT